jgi:hypothetical protein
VQERTRKISKAIRTIMVCPFLDWVTGTDMS